MMKSVQKVDICCLPNHGKKHITMTISIKRDTISNITFTTLVCLV